MDKTQLTAFKKKLSEEIKSTAKIITQYSELCKPIAPENSIGRVSRMDAINNKSVVEAALRMAKEKMYQLKRMEKKSSDVNFGICKKCKNPIPTGRLMIRPHSNFCVTCAD